MTTAENIREVTPEDRQILHETVTNEKLVTHPTLGLVRLKMPTLEIQRKIDSAARARKKYLKEAKDKVEDSEAPGGFKFVPAFRSKEQLKKEYSDLGWWTQEQEDELQDLIRQQMNLLTQLELLEFDSEEEIYEMLKECQDKLLELFKDFPEIRPIIIKITIPGIPTLSQDETTLKEKATSTEVDDLLDTVTKFQEQYTNYADLAKLFNELSTIQNEYNSLFSDCWQEQLQYYIRLAQVFYCTEKADTNKPIWESIDGLEKDKDLEIVRWVFGELTAFWQGLSDELREKMAKYGFTNRRSEKDSYSEDSPDPSKLSVDGELQEKSPESSLTPTITADQSPTLS